MNKYEIIIYWSEVDNAYIAEVPELAGCMADGKTYSEALKNAKIIINEWKETADSLGREIPEPHGNNVYLKIFHHEPHELVIPLKCLKFK
jgi:predicted RNase H-like HicB family nuclease